MNIFSCDKTISLGIKKLKSDHCGLSNDSCQKVAKVNIVFFIQRKLITVD